MKKLLWIKDSEEFWQTFTKEREKDRARLRALPFAKKIDIVAKMQEEFRPLRRKSRGRRKPIGTADKRG